MKKIIILNKKEGETPLEALKKFQKKNPGYKEIPMTYAGRLDPMASGVLLILTGKEIKNKQKYLEMKKEYNFTVLFGFSTDTYDILGKVISHKNINFSNKELEVKIKKYTKEILGQSYQKYPIYSSKTVGGKPLFTYAREDKKVKIPERKINISSLKLKSIRKTDNKKLLINIEKRVRKVKGDFRQNEILKIWKEKLVNASTKNFLLADFEIKCSSGTYVRSISHSLGENIKIPSLAFSIKRIKLGRYKISKQ